MCPSFLAAATAETRSALTKGQTEVLLGAGRSSLLKGCAAAWAAVPAPAVFPNTSGHRRQMKPSFSLHLLNTGTSSPTEGLGTSTSDSGAHLLLQPSLQKPSQKGCIFSSVKQNIAK